MLIGKPGKEGRTFQISDKYVVKTFRSDKDKKHFILEYLFQKRASEAGIAPKVYGYNIQKRYFIMEKMDSHLIAHLIYKKSVSLEYQKQIYSLFCKLDAIELFHNDSNLCNYMIKDDQIYLIDYGFTREITRELKNHLQTENVNQKIMLIGFLKRLKEINIDPSSCSYLMSKLEEQI